MDQAGAFLAFAIHIFKKIWWREGATTSRALGDCACATLPRCLSVIAFSIYPAIFLAFITGEKASYCQGRMATRLDEGVAHFTNRFENRLEHLPDLSHEYLVELPEKVKRIEDCRL